MKRTMVLNCQSIALHGLHTELHEQQIQEFVTVQPAHRTSVRAVCGHTVHPGLFRSSLDLGRSHVRHSSDSTHQRPRFNRADILHIRQTHTKNPLAYSWLRANDQPLPANTVRRSQRRSPRLLEYLRLRSHRDIISLSPARPETRHLTHTRPAQPASCPSPGLSQP